MAFRFTVAVFDMFDTDPVNAVYILMEAVVAQLKAEIEKDEDGRAQAYGQTEDIDKGETSVFSQVAKGHQKIGFEHPIPPDSNHLFWN
jgi:hypothetical protein